MNLKFNKAFNENLSIAMFNAGGFGPGVDIGTPMTMDPVVPMPSRKKKKRKKKLKEQHITESTFRDWAREKKIMPALAKAILPLLMAGCMSTSHDWSKEFNYRQMNRGYFDQPELFDYRAFLEPWQADIMFRQIGKPPYYKDFENCKDFERAIKVWAEKVNDFLIDVDWDEWRT